MDFNIGIDVSVIRNQNHLLNLHKHITRTAKKYDAIRDEIFVYVAKPMDENLVYNKNLVHIVVQAESHDFDGVEMTPIVFQQREDLEMFICSFIGEKLVDIHDEIKELTIVVGMQPDGSYIAPCIHIIYEAEDVTDDSWISDFVSSISLLGNIILDADIDI